MELLDRFLANRGETGGSLGGGGGVYLSDKTGAILVWSSDLTNWLHINSNGSRKIM